MEKEHNKAVIIGASGLIGNHLLFLLLEDSFFEKVTVLVRKPLAVQHPKLEQIVDNFDEPSAYRLAIQDANHAFCCLGTTMKTAGSKEAFTKVDFGYPALFAQQCVLKGVPHFYLVSALGADSNSSIFYNQIKGEIENLILDQPFNSISIVRPSLLMGKRNEFRLGEKIAQLLAPFLNIFLIGPLQKYQSIRAEVVAESLLQLAKNNQDQKLVLESDQMKKYIKSKRNEK